MPYKIKINYQKYHTVKYELVTRAIADDFVSFLFIYFFSSCTNHAVKTNTKRMQE